METKVPEEFVDLVTVVTDRIAGLALDNSLELLLNQQFPATGRVVRRMTELCHRGCREGWLCQREAGGILFGRPVQPSARTGAYSVDVVEMTDVVGPHHAHPNGEIDLVMAIDAGAAFDGIERGWKVYPPGSAHYPTVTGGKARVLYLLPEGAIEFTRA